MFCGNCGAEVKEGDRFCQSCGAALEEQQSGREERPDDRPGCPSMDRASDAQGHQDAGDGPQAYQSMESDLGRQEYKEAGGVSGSQGYQSMVQEEYQPQYQPQYQSQYQPEYQETSVKPVKKGHGFSVACAVLCAVIVILAAGIVFGLYRLHELNEEAENYPVPQLAESTDGEGGKDSEKPAADEEEKTAEKDGTEEEDKKDPDSGEEDKDTGKSKEQKDEKSGDKTEKDADTDDEKIEITATPVPTAVPTAAPTPAPTQTPAVSGEYIFADSSSRYLTYEEIAALSEQEMSYARNEIYARHGRKFSSEELQNYFNSKSWYTPIYEGADFDAMQDSVFNEYEKANVRLITQVEKDKGYE